MKIRLLNLVTLFSLLLSLAAAAMWARSHLVTEVWEFNPRPSGLIFGGQGWYEHRTVESGGGRLVYTKYRLFIRATDPPIVSGYQRRSDRFSPMRPNRRVPNYPLPSSMVPPPTSSGRIPGVAEWSSMPGYAFIPPGEFFTVSWLAMACIGGVLPGVRWGRQLWRWWKRPAFPVVTADPPSVAPTR
jgi:hypothetical protein